jgi:hypothetical protein
MKKKLILLITVFLNLFLWSDVMFLMPTDDMYTDPDHPGVNPVLTELWTANFNPSGNFQRIMIKFDLLEYIGHTAESAYLNLTRFYSCPSGGTTAATFYAISQEWDENSWNHTQHIEYDNSINMPYVSAVQVEMQLFTFRLILPIL